MPHTLLVAGRTSDALSRRRRRARRGALAAVVFSALVTTSLPAAPAAAAMRTRGTQVPVLAHRPVLRRETPGRIERALAARATTRRATAPRPVTAPPPGAPARRLDWGLYAPEFPGALSDVDGVERTVGRHADIVMWYVHWAGPWSGFDAATLRAVLHRGSTPMITWMSDDPWAAGYPATSSQRAYSLRAIADGRFDAYIRSWADGLRLLGAPVLLRLDHEMNGSWYAWSPGVNGQTAADYLAMWHHVHDVVVGAGATNVQWVWSPNVEYGGSVPLAALYPGDAYVDRVGVDGYNWGPHDPWHRWQTFAEVFDPTLARITTLTRRPLMITEVASAASGGDKAAWMRDFFAAMARRPAITGFVWFDANKEEDWRLTSSPATTSAFAAGLAGGR